MRFNAMFILSFSALLLGGCSTAPRLHDRLPTSAAGTDPVAAGTPSEPSEVALIALSLVGTRYAAGGGSPETGFDCSGLVAYVFARSMQLRLPRNTFDLARTGTAVEPGALRPGDLVFYNTQRRAFSHVGIYLGDARFVHAPSTGGAVRIEEMDLRYWTQRFNGARRVSF
ncbi:MAG TPA: C40 family peptidase [Burkholderiales bacterium]|nr:C40 family peptidase [Burkholderiales bacterium]